MACKRSAVRFRLAPPFPEICQNLLPLTIYMIDKVFMNELAVTKSLKSGRRQSRRKSLCQGLGAALMFALCGCAQVQNIAGLFAAQPASAATMAPLARQNAGQSPQAVAPAQRLDRLESEKRAMAKQLQAAEQTALLVQIEGGDISVHKAADLARCQTAKAAISGMPGRQKQAVPPYKSAFSVGSVSPYMPHHLLISTCLPLAIIEPL